MQLSKHFSVAEFIDSDTADRHGIDNDLPAALLPNAKRVCEQILEPLRQAWDCPIVILSGYRSPLVNRLVGSSDSSQHTKGQAVDFRFTNPALTPLEVCRWMERGNFPYDQLIHEFGRWVHVSVAPEGQKPRRQELTIDKRGTRPGLHEVRR